MAWLGEPPLLLFGTIRAPEIAIILVVALLIFGAARLPKIGASLGHSLRAFKSAVTGELVDEAEETKGKKLESAAKDDEQG